MKNFLVLVILIMILLVGGFYYFVLREEELNSPAGLITVKGFVHIGPTCPVVQVGREEECRDRPYAVSIEVHYPNKGLYKIIKSSAAGTFSIALPVGEYILRPQVANVLLACEEKRIVVMKGKTLNVDISCDSGIR